MPYDESINKGFLLMKITKIENSSAIAKVMFPNSWDEKVVGISYNSNPDKFYMFECETPSKVEEDIMSADSVGKLISSLKKEGILKVVAA